MSADFIVGVVGNPNCGKTTLFNVLTGSRQQVGNWPGVTVEKKTGEYRHQGKCIELVDLPGTYSLESDDDSISLDEKVARDYVASRQAHLVINIIDAANIERNLYLTSQLLEMRVPMIVVLNMMDAVKKRGIKIDIETLSHRLGCPVVPVTAASGSGIKELRDIVSAACLDAPTPNLQVQYQAELESAVAELQAQLPIHPECDSRWLALRLLENDTLAKRFAGPDMLPLVNRLRERIEAETGDEIDILAADARYGLVNQLVQAAVCKLNEVSRSTTDKIDSVVLNRFLGIPVFLLVMYAMFMFTINIGSAFVDFFDKAVGALLVDGLGARLTGWQWPAWLVVLICNGIGGGIQVVSTFIPIVGFLFIFLSALEDSGYMSRAAFVMDRFMCILGLPGKSFVPMIVGFGCNVPAIIATRTLDNQRDRILTNLMNPFMSCGARLPVYALFAAAFFPVGGQNLVFGLYLFGIAVAVVTGLIMRHTLLRGAPTPFLMELPAYHLPTLQGIYTKTWERLKTFIVNAGKIIVPMVLVLNVLNSLGSDGSFGRENSDQSILSGIGKSLTPLFGPLGIAEDNWPATVGIFTGVLAKEAVVGTLDALYSQMAAGSSDSEATEFDLGTALREALQTVPDNLAAVADRLLDPLGLGIATSADQAEAAEKQQVKLDTFAVMQSHFDGKIGAFAYLVFILLYAPCVAATAAIYKETNGGWALFTVCWTTFIAYLSATLFYQIMTYDQHPQATLSWLSGLTLIFLGILAGLRYVGNHQTEGVLP
ncbi:Fe(2+) transporter permease subunit FeoB [Methylomonas sp. MED-D]|uniref:Fe(2+) transporter permease subunit FeoB n=1 Tax=unclassified Methylomonas TaxID=2608980 RepID=UPI0028A535D2|nr:Fe(2+) transporter permease subunit FeoB [Methylomonas sp. MV1]MDT4328430.1 Fe(2+) transporter permease subunit FeoB [Methylomonas sp. MV1]